MIGLTKSGILNSIKKVDDERIDKNHLILNSIKNFEIKENDLDIDLSLSIPQTSVNDELKSKITKAIKEDFPELSDVKLNILAKISSHTDKRKDALLPGVKNTVAVASGKGGVGKSTVAVNLAVALAKDGANVGLIDADIYGPSIPLMLGIKEKPKIFQKEDKVVMQPVENYGIKLISIGFLIDDDAPVIWRGPMASGAIKQFMSDVNWGELDYLVFDMPPGTGDIQLTLVQTIPLTGVVIVTTPQEVSLIDARKALKMFNRVNVPVAGVVENMSYFLAPDTGKKYDIFGFGGGEQLSKDLNIPFLGGIPIDSRIRIGGDKGVPIVFDLPDTEYSDIITGISRNLAEQINLINLNASSKVEILLDDEE
ncbi:MAG: ATP-binding protein [Ignavibacteria bacterium RBG_16_34_14]|nr:MAG: ATP-binding protein [Ignavibacteria bacterium RBG_16_34_14]